MNNSWDVYTSRTHLDIVTERIQDYEGLNRETSWILVTDHFSKQLYGDARISKASPIQWLRHLLANHSPVCPDKYVYMDQGGELYKNPEVVALFEGFGYTIRPTGADASNQNGPVERAHQTISNCIRAMLQHEVKHPGGTPLYSPSVDR